MKLMLVCAVEIKTLPLQGGGAVVPVRLPAHQVSLFHVVYRLSPLPPHPVGGGGPTRLHSAPTSFNPCFDSRVHPYGPRHLCSRIKPPLCCAAPLTIPGCNTHSLVRTRVHQPISRLRRRTLCFPPSPFAFGFLSCSLLLSFSVFTSLRHCFRSPLFSRLPAPSHVLHLSLRLIRRCLPSQEET